MDLSLLVDDRALLQRFREGESAALATVFRHYAPGVAAQLRRGFVFATSAERVRFEGYDDLFDLEDVIQDVFRRAFSEQARLQYDGLRPYRIYLGAIARNAVIDHYLQRRRQLDRYRLEGDSAAPTDAWSAAHDPLGESDNAAATGRPEEDIEAAELRRLVALFKESLKERELSIFQLRFEDGLSHAEITERTGVSASRIKTSEARIRRRLLRYLHQQGYLGGVHDVEPLALQDNGEEA